MQDRGADEVVAIDVLDPKKWDWPVTSSPDTMAAIGERKALGSGFELVMRALGRDVERRELSVYDLDPGSIGAFDFVYVGSVILHLRDPVRALERVRAVCKEELVLVDSFDPFLTALHPRSPVASLDGENRPWWWHANVAGWSAWSRLRAFGSRMPRTSDLATRRPPTAHQGHSERLALSCSQKTYRTARFGDPHAVVRAKPR